MSLPFALPELDAPLGPLPSVFGTALAVAADAVLADLVGTGGNRSRNGHPGQQRPERRRE